MNEVKGLHEYMKELDTTVAIVWPSGNITYELLDDVQVVIAANENIDYKTQEHITNRLLKLDPQNMLRLRLGDEGKKKTYWLAVDTEE